MDEIFAETSKETVKELSLLSLTGASADSVTIDESHGSSACNSDMDFFDSWYDDNSASDTVLVEHDADLCEDVYRIVENETQIISGPFPWPPPTPQPLHTKRKGRLSRFLAKFKKRRHRERSKIGRMSFREKENKSISLLTDTVFDLEQTEISGRKKVAPEVPRDDVIIPIFNTDILKCPVVVTEPLPVIGTYTSKSVVCRCPCHMTDVCVHTGEVALTANHGVGRPGHATACELPTTVDSMVEPRDEAVSRVDFLDIGARQPDGTSQNQREFHSRIPGPSKCHY